MRKRQNEFAIGLSVTVAMIIVIGGILWLNKTNFLESGLHIKMRVKNAHGISVGDDVVYNGVSVGTLQSAHLIESGVVLNLKISGVQHIPEDSRFAVKESGLLGSHVVEIVPGNSTNYLKNGSEVIGSEGGGLLDIIQRGGQLSGQLSKVLANIDSLSGEKVAGKVYSTLSELRSASKTMNILLKENKVKLAETIANLQKMSEENKEPLHKILNQLSRKSENLALTIEQTQRLSQEMDSLMRKINRGEGSLGKLIYDESLYTNMNNTFLHLDSLIQDIHRNPKKFLGVKVF
ncbi:hypothetical protein B6D60_04510 [candidate division KSB1 bacterium 4484_87]|nr:MAG: hypothetical protein B6D60_04510 [candidate division KSB1 bacterium 4484_87]